MILLSYLSTYLNVFVDILFKIFLVLLPFFIFVILYEYFKGMCPLSLFYIVDFIIFAVVFYIFVFLLTFCC